MLPRLDEVRRQLSVRLRRAPVRRGRPGGGDRPPGPLDPGPFASPTGPGAAGGPPGPRVALLNDCRDQANYGAVALVEGLLAILSRALPNLVVVPVPSHWLMDTTSGFDAFVDAGAGMARPRARFPAVADQFDALGEDWLEGRGGPDADLFLGQLRGADLVVLNGEGSLYRSNQSAFRELFLAWLAREHLGLPTVFLNGTVHLTDVVPVLPAMVGKAFTRLDAVAVREPCSLRNLAQFLPEVPARMIPDSAFAGTADQARHSAAVRAVRARIGDRPYFCFDPGAMPMDHRSPQRSPVYALVRSLKDLPPEGGSPEGRGLEAVLVASAPQDRYIRRIAVATGSVYVEDLGDHREYMALVGSAAFALSGRYHNPILAAIMGCPSITFASANHKVHGACELLDGVLGTPYDSTSLGPALGAIEHQARAYLAAGDGLRERLRQICERRRAETAELGDLAAAHVRAPGPGSAPGSGPAPRAG